jgi:hypothetical protein
MGRIIGMKSNEEIFKEFIEERKCETLSTSWVLWMLEQLRKATRTGARINPAWLRADQRFIGDNEPPMNPEPPVRRMRKARKKIAAAAKAK